MDQMNPRFIINNGLRKVVPYYQTNSTNAKGHWVGKKVLDLLSGEFKVRSTQYYLDQIANGSVQITRKGEVIKGNDLLDLIIQHKDILQTTGHKHEAQVVYYEKIPVIHQDENVIVVDKPSSVPVHPTGRFYYNSVTELIKIQENLPNIFPCYRLDKLTSGVLVLGKTGEVAGMIHKKIKEKGITKNYLARVSGYFPDSISCEEPVSSVVPKMGFAYGKGTKKDAATEFKRVRYNSELDQSIVLCKPLTGRTHQIRIHLNFLKHPIINDPLYGPESSVIRRKIVNSDTVLEDDFDELVKEVTTYYKSLERDNICDLCGYEELKDSDPEKLVMYLHAIKYSSNDGEWSYESSEPDWCNI